MSLFILNDLPGLIRKGSPGEPNSGELIHNSPTGERLRAGPAGRLPARRARADRHPLFEDGEQPSEPSSRFTDRSPPECPAWLRKQGPAVNGSVALADAREYGSTDNRPGTRNEPGPEAAVRVAVRSRTVNPTFTHASERAKSPAAAANPGLTQRGFPERTGGFYTVVGSAGSGTGGEQEVRPAAQGRARRSRAFRPAVVEPNAVPRFGGSFRRLGNPLRRTLLGLFHVQVVGRERDVLKHEHRRAGSGQPRALSPLVVAAQRPNPRATAAMAVEPVLHLIEAALDLVARNHSPDRTSSSVLSDAAKQIGQEQPERGELLRDPRRQVGGGPEPDGKAAQDQDLESVPVEVALDLASRAG